MNYLSLFLSIFSFARMGETSNWPVNITYPPSSLQNIKKYILLNWRLLPALRTSQTYSPPLSIFFVGILKDCF